MTEKKGALAGIRIVDLSTVLLGPWATQILGDMGADIIKVESPDGDMSRFAGPGRNSGMASLFMNANRNKRSVVLDLKAARGMAALHRLVATADVVLHNLRPRAAAGLGVGYEEFARLNPRLIFCAAYGFRKDGPMANNPAYDDVIQAAAGLAMLQTVATDEPRYVPTAIADKITGMATANAILAALLHRERTGRGQAVEVTMFETLVDFVMVEHLAGACFDPPVAGMGYSRILTPMRRPYRTLDGHVAVLPYTDRNWQDFFRIAGRPDLAGNPRFVDHATRIAHSQEIYALLADIVATRDTDFWQRELAAANIPVQAVLSKEQLLDEPHLHATGFWQFREHPSEGALRLTEPPIRFSDSPSSIRRLQPRHGEHSAEVLREAGLSGAEIDALFADGISRAG